MTKEEWYIYASQTRLYLHLCRHTHGVERDTYMKASERWAIWLTVNAYLGSCLEPVWIHR